MDKKMKTDNKNIVLLSMAKLLSSFAFYLYDIGIVIYLFDETQSVAVVGGFFVSQLLPAFIILLSGALIDRYNKKNLLVLSNLGKAAIFALLICVQNIWVIYIATFVLNFLLEFENNAYQAFMTNVFEKKKLLKMASIINLLESASMIIAPVSAAFITMYLSFQANLILAIALFVFSAITYMLLKSYPYETMDKAERLAGGKGYFKIIKDKKVFTTIIFWSLFMLCIGIAGPLEISMIEDVLGMPSAYYGIGNTVEGVGMLLASGLILGILRRLNSKDIILIGLFCAAFSYLLIGVSHTIWIYFIGAGVVGVTAALCPLGFKTDIQLNSEGDVIGRTFATARFVVLLSRMAGAVLVGWALRLFDIREIYYGLFGVLIFIAFLYGGLRRHQREIL